MKSDILLVPLKVIKTIDGRLMYEVDRINGIVAPTLHEIGYLKKNIQNIYYKYEDLTADEKQQYGKSAVKLSSLKLSQRTAIRNDKEIAELLNDENNIHLLPCHIPNELLDSNIYALTRNSHKTWGLLPVISFRGHTEDILSGEGKYGPNLYYKFSELSEKDGNEYASEVIKLDEAIDLAEYNPKKYVLKR